jgi:hypothetical protein
VTEAFPSVQLSAEHRKQVPHFTVDFLGSVHGVGDFLTKKRAKTLAHPGDLLPQGFIGQAEHSGDFAIPRLRIGFEQVGLQMVEDLVATAPRIVRFQSAQHQIKQSQGPFPFIDALRSQFVNWLPSQVTFIVCLVQREGLLAPSALSRPAAFPVVGEKVLEAAQEEGAKLGAILLHNFGRQVVFQEMEEKTLSEIFGVARLKSKA